MKGFLSALFSPAGLFLLVLLAARLTFIQQIGLELSPDEAYYWDWSRHLAWGYYSKPPMVAWIIHFFTKNLGNTEYAVRVPAALLGTLYLAFIYYLGQHLFDRRVGLWAALAAAATPLASIYSFVMTIDPPLLFFWSLALCVGWQAAQNRRLIDFLFLGVVIACGLLTKQTMFAFLVVYLLWLYVDRVNYSWFKEWKIYCMLVVVLVLVSPNIVWNIKNNWIMFKHTHEHFQGQDFFLLGPFLFLLEQAGVITPIIFSLMLFVFYTFIRSPKLKRNRPLSYLFCMSALPLIMVLPLSFLRKVNANWPYPFYSSAYVLLSALVLYGKWPKNTALFWRRLFYLGVCLGMFIAFLIYQIPRTPNIFPLPLQKLLYKFSGWKDLANFVQKNRDPYEIIIASRRQYASELSFYLPDHPRVYTYWTGRVRSQYDIWDDLLSQRGKNVLLVLKNKKEIQKLKACFEDLFLVGRWEKYLFGKKRKVWLYRGQRLRLCPYLGPESSEGK